MSSTKMVYRSAALFVALLVAAPLAEAKTRRASGQKKKELSPLEQYPFGAQASTAGRGGAASSYPAQSSWTATGTA